MVVWSQELEFNEAFMKRLRALRDERDWTAEQMAIALGIPAANYRKYETRSMMPLYLLPRLAQIMDRDVEYLMTGRSSDRLRRSKKLITGTNG